jgi:hypothetical protein
LEEIWYHQSRILVQILLRSNMFLNLQLKMCDMNQWIFQPLLQLLSQSVDGRQECSSYVEVLPFLEHLNHL